MLRSLPAIIITTAHLAIALMGSKGLAGPRELEALLESPAGRSLLAHLGAPTETRVADNLTAQEISQAESQFARVREGLLAKEPLAANSFAPGGRALTPLEEQALVQILRQEDVSALRTLRFVQAPRVAPTGNFASASRSFLNPVTAKPQTLSPHQGGGMGSPERAEKFRLALRDLMAASAHADSALQAQAMREAMARNPELAVWYFEGEDFSGLMKTAELDMGPHFDAQAMVSKSVKSQLRAAAQRQAQGNPLVESAVDSMVDKIMAAKPGSAGSGLAEKTVTHFADQPYESRLQTLKSVGDEPFINASREIDAQLQDIRVSEVPAVKQIFAPDTGIDLSQFPKDKAVLFERLLTRYFDQMAPVDKKRIVIAMLDLPPGSGVEQKLSAVLQNSGPAIQKLFQLVGRDAKGPLVRNVMKELLSNIRPVDGATVRTLIEAELGRPLNEVFFDFSEKPLAAASVGQVHRATLRSTGEQVVVKVLKPGVKDKALRELDTIKSIIGDTEFEKDLVANIEDALLKELDLRIEAQNLEKGLGYVSQVRGIAIAGAVPGTRVTENLLIQRMAKGTVLSKARTPLEIAQSAGGAYASPYAKKQAIKELTERGDALERLLGRWFERSIYGDGFFHADLHPGNLFYLQDPMGKAKPLLTMIDFGSADSLSLLQRRGFVQFSVATAMKSPEQALVALGRFSDIPPGSHEAYLSGLRQLFDNPSIGIVERVQQGFLLSVQHEMRVPREIFMFTRGNLFLEKQLQEVNRALAILDPAGKVGRYDPIMTYLRVSSQHAALEAPIKGMRLLPRRVREFLFDIMGKESDPRVATEIFNDQTLLDVWAASKEQLLNAIR